jgi:hypothetical protein
MIVYLEGALYVEHPLFMALSKLGVSAIMAVDCAIPVDY